MSIFNYLLENLRNEDDRALSLDGEDVPTPTPEKPEPTISPEESSIEGDPKALVDALIKYAPGKEKQIKNMLKYAANSGQEYDIFDSAYDYYESIEDGLSDDEQPIEDSPEDDELTLDKEAPTDDENELNLSDI